MKFFSENLTVELSCHQLANVSSFFLHYIDLPQVLFIPLVIIFNAITEHYALTTE
jgi:hypothetical protein